MKGTRCVWALIILWRIEIIVFFMLLSNYAKMWLSNYQMPIKLMVDNTCIHISSLSKRTKVFSNFEIDSLSPCSPRLSQVEIIFRLSKRLFQNQVILKLSTSVSQAIVNSFMNIKKWTVLKMWRHIIKEAKLCIFDNKRAFIEKIKIRG